MLFVVKSTQAVVYKATCQPQNLDADERVGYVLYFACTVRSPAEGWLMAIVVRRRPLFDTATHFDPMQDSGE